VEKYKVIFNHRHHHLSTFTRGNKAIKINRNYAMEKFKIFVCFMMSGKWIFFCFFFGGWEAAKWLFKSGIS
jgi:hypothetical protein